MDDKQIIEGFREITDRWIAELREETHEPESTAGHEPRHQHGLGPVPEAHQD